MKKWIGLVLAAVLLAGGCGTDKVATQTVSMYDLRTTMEAADESLPSMLNASSAEDGAADKFVHISDMDYGKVDSFFVSYSEEGMADEIAVIAVKDMADVQEAKKSLEDHKQNRYQLLQQYEPKEVKRIEDGLVFASGQYAVLIICDDAASVKKAFEDMVAAQ